MKYYKTFLLVALSIFHLCGCKKQMQCSKPGDDSVLSEKIIMTVRGPIKATQLGNTLVHEHIMCDFVGAEKTGSDRYNRQEVIKTMLPFLKEVKERGIDSFVDCSPDYIGQDAEVIRCLSQLSGLHIVTNTGFYGAADDKYIPDYAYTDTADQLAKRWISKWENGIGTEKIKPGFIKIGVDPGPLSEIDRKLVLAATKTHMKTGLTIACHTGEEQAALEVLDTVTAEGIDPSALIIVHADSIQDSNLHLQLAASGTWVEYDSIGTRNIKEHVQLIKKMIDAGFQDRLLISHDAGWYQVGEKGGGKNIRGFTAISDELVGALQKAGVKDGTIEKLLVDNPAKALAIWVRKLGVLCEEESCCLCA